MKLRDALWAVMAVFGLWAASSAYAEGISIDSVYPNVGKLGEDFGVTIRGSGFDANTRVSMSLDVLNRWRIIGSFDNDSALDVCLWGSAAYVNSGDLIDIMDIHDITRPISVGSVDTPGKCNDIAVMDGFAYVADDDRGLQVLDLTDPLKPTMMGSVDTPGKALAVAVAGHIAYVADDDGGLQVMDISDPWRPAIKGSLNTRGKATDVAVSGGLACVSDSLDGLLVVNVTQPHAPIKMGAVDTPGDAGHIALVHETAYVADDAAGLRMIDVSDPATPKIAGSVDTPGSALGVAVAGNTAYVADTDGGLQVIDVGDPIRPRIIGSVDTPGWASKVAVADQVAYVADLEAGLQIIDVRNPDHQPLTASVDTPGFALDVAMGGRLAYVADGPGGLCIVDLTDFSNPKIAGSVDTPGSAAGVAVSGSYVFVADRESGIQVVDAADPENPAIIGAANTPGNAEDIAITGQMAFVADGSAGLQVLDIGNPAQPIITGNAPLAGFAHGVAVEHPYLYVACGAGGLHVVDVSDPANPARVGGLDTEDAVQGIAVSGSTAYVTDGESKLMVIDVSDPHAPFLVDSVDIPPFSTNWLSLFMVEDVVVSQQTAYVTVSDALIGESGVYAVDVSRRPGVIVGSVFTLGSASSAAIADNLAYVADGDAGLTIVPVPEAISSVQYISSTELRVFIPAPSLAGHYNLRVFNQTESDELTGAVTFFESAAYQNQLQKKAVIAAGGGSDPSDRLVASIRACTNLAYLSLLSQGYLRENIRFLAPHSGMDVDGDGLLNDVDGPCTSAALAGAVTGWGADAGELLVYLADHGGEGEFYANDGDRVTAESLDAWLDAVQAAIPGKVVVIYDACASGSFLPLLIPPPGKDRIVVTGSLADEPAWFMSDGVLSFSYQFWQSVFANAYLVDSFNIARNMMAYGQTGMMDANGDGEQTPEDANLAREFAIGRGRVADVSPPFIGAVSPQQTLAQGSQAASFQAWDITAADGIQKVWAVLVPPGFESGSDTEVTNLDSVDLTDPDKDGVYAGAYDRFIQPGTWTVSIHVKDVDGQVSLPKTTTVIQPSSLLPGDINGDGRTNLTDAVAGLKICAGDEGNQGDDPDDYEDDDNWEKANAISLNSQVPEHRDIPGYEWKQDHNFHDQNDEDWVLYYAFARDENYKLEVFDPGSRCDAAIEIYSETDFAHPIAVKDDFLAGEREYIEWQCKQDGMYYFRIRQADPGVYGDNTGYSLTLTIPKGAYPGVVYGSVSPRVRTTITTSGRCSAVTNSAGSYYMPHPAGTFKMTARATGYRVYYASFTLKPLQRLYKTIYLRRAASRRGTETPGQESSAVRSVQVVNPEADVNGDDRIGMVEVMYLLRKIMGDD